MKGRKFPYKTMPTNKRNYEIRKSLYNGNFFGILATFLLFENVK